MKITRALITLADPQQRSLPLHTLIDQNGDRRSALELVLSEAIEAGIEEVGLIVSPDSQAAYSSAAGEHANRLTFIEQSQPDGYAQAILLGRDFIGNAPFLHIVGDHLCVSESTLGCARQVVEIAEANQVSVSGVQATHESQINSFGAIGGRLVDRSHGLYQVESVLEKPTPTQAELKLNVPGTRAGYYLCFFGIHALQPGIFDCLLETTKRSAPGSKSLSAALDLFAQREKLLAYEVQGKRFDIGSDYGLLFAQLALAFSGKDRDQVVTGILEMLATR